MIKHILLIITISICIGIRLFAKNYYVNGTTGNNNNNGLTIGSAKKTLNWISYNSQFQPGDTIFIMNGTYSSTSADVITLTSSGSATSPFVITNYPGDAPILQHTVNTWNGIKVLSGVHHVIINGLTVKGIASSIDLNEAINQSASCDNRTGSANPKFNGNGISIESSKGAVGHHITIRNCTIFECCGGGCGASGADYLTYENNLIYNNCWYTIFGTSGISNLSSRDYDNHTSGGYSMIIRNNIIYGNQLYVKWSSNYNVCKIYDGNGIIIDSQNGSNYTGKTLVENNLVHHNGGRGIHMLNSSNVDVLNNSCFMNCRTSTIADGEITIQGTASNFKVFNNIIYARKGNRANSSTSSATNFSHGNNLIYNAISGNISFTNSTDILGKDPEFIDTSFGGNFQLKATSVAINAGTYITGLYSIKDITGFLRDGKPDIGAYEKSSVTAVMNAVSNSNNFINIYPNPAHETTEITYQLIKYSEVKISVFDILGKETIQVLNEIQNEGNHKLVVNTQLFQKGIYFVKMNLNGEELTKKLVINN